MSQGLRDQVTNEITASATWRNRIAGHADVAPAALVPKPRNWRSHPREQQLALAGALGEVGWVAEILVNRTTGHVVDGHLRIELALARAEPTVPVTYVELTEVEARRAGRGSTGDVDRDALAGPKARLTVTSVSSRGVVRADYAATPDTIVRLVGADQATHAMRTGPTALASQGSL
jgi:hypothetical protein